MMWGKSALRADSPLLVEGAICYCAQPFEDEPQELHELQRLQPQELQRLHPQELEVLLLLPVDVPATVPF